jgi:hypothetical protein
VLGSRKRMGWLGGDRHHVSTPMGSRARRPRAPGPRDAASHLLGSR